MRAVIQRVKSAILKVDGKLISQIEKGFLVFLGIKNTDTEQDLTKVGKKISGLRIFEDENEKMNLGLKDIGGEILLVSQFTLYGDCRHGNRPSFIEAERPERANQLYLKMKEFLQQDGHIVKTGVFGADMQIEAHNDGPVTIMIDSAELK